MTNEQKLKVITRLIKGYFKEQPENAFGFMLALDEVIRINEEEEQQNDD